MDLEARVRSFFDAVSANDPGAILAFMAPGVSYQLEGRKAMGLEALAVHIRQACSRIGSVAVRVGAVVVKRNVTFVEWRGSGTLADGRPFETHGVHVLSWDQDGRIAHATVHAAPPGP